MDKKWIGVLVAVLGLIVLTIGLYGIVFQSTTCSVTGDTCSTHWALSDVVVYVGIIGGAIITIVGVMIVMWYLFPPNKGAVAPLNTPLTT